MKITHASAQTLTDLCADQEEEKMEFNDGWDEIAAQLDYWALLDAEYWRHRRENEYRLFLERKYGAAWTQ